MQSHLKRRHVQSAANCCKLLAKHYESGAAEAWWRS